MWLEVLEGGGRVCFSSEWRPLSNPSVVPDDIVVPSESGVHTFCFVSKGNEMRVLAGGSRIAYQVKMIAEAHALTPKIDLTLHDTYGTELATAHFNHK